MFYILSVIVLSIIQIFWFLPYISAILDETNTIVGGTIAFLLTYPLLVIMVMNVFLAGAMMLFYPIIWVWLEPIIYFTLIAKHRKSNHQWIHRVKITSYIVAPIMLFFLSFTSETVDLTETHPEYFTNDYPRCAMTNPSTYNEYTCTSNPACRWEYTTTNEVGTDVYECCPIDENERNAQDKLRGSFYPDCIRE